MTISSTGSFYCRTWTRKCCAVSVATRLDILPGMRVSPIVSNRRRPICRHFSHSHNYIRRILNCKSLVIVVSLAATAVECCPRISSTDCSLQPSTDTSRFWPPAWWFGCRVLVSTYISLAAYIYHSCALFRILFRRRGGRL